MANPTYKTAIPNAAVENRSRRISQLLPFVSNLRHSQNAEARAIAIPLQETVRDLERLNDIEMLCRAADDKTGPTLWLAIIEVLEKP
jgi:hypothetical protein